MSVRSGASTTRRIDRRALLGGAAVSGAALLAGGATATAASTASAGSAAMVAPAARLASKQEVELQEGGEFRGFFVWPRTLNMLVQGQNAGQMGELLWGRLYGIGTDAETTTPLLATGWAIADDGTQITFTLRDDVQWHDGASFSANDVEFTIRAIAAQATTSPLYGRMKLQNLLGAEEFRDGAAENIAGVRVIDDTTVEFTYAKPIPTMIWDFSFFVAFPEHLLGDVPYDQLLDHEYWNAPIGTGPFKFNQWVPDQFLQFDRNDDYYLGAPILDRVFLTLYQDQETMVAALEAGEIDFVRVLSADNYARVKEMPNVGIVGGPAYILQCININNERFPDKRVRQALFYGLDRPALIEGIMGPELATLAEAPSVAGGSWYAEGLPQYTYDPEKAKALLAEAGFDMATPIEISYNYEDQTSQNLCAAMQQYWAALGLTNVSVTFYENAVHNTLYESGEYDVAYDAGGGLGIDPSAALEDFGLGGAYNRMRYDNETVDALLREVQTTMDASERDEIYKQVQEILNDELPALALWEVNRYSGLSNRIANFPWANMGGPEHYYPASHLWAIKAE